MNMNEMGDIAAIISLLVAVIAEWAKIKSFLYKVFSSTLNLLSKLFVLFFIGV